MKRLARHALWVDIDGFSLYASVHMALKLETSWLDGATQLVMSPLEFMQRLAALVKRPKLHRTRLTGCWL